MQVPSEVIGAGPQRGYWCRSLSAIVGAIVAVALAPAFARGC